VPGKIVRDLAKEVVGEGGTTTKRIAGEAADRIDELFDLGHKVTRAADEAGQNVFALSWDEEQKVGREVHEMLAREFTFVRPSAAIQRLQRLVQPIIALRTRKELIITLEVFLSPAFRSSPGGNPLCRGKRHVSYLEHSLQSVPYPAEIRFAEPPKSSIESRCGDRSHLKCVGCRGLFKVVRSVGLDSDKPLATIEAILPARYGNYGTQCQDTKRIAACHDSWTHFSDLVADGWIEIHEPNLTLENNHR
jgi:hypothetical protein